MDTLDTIKTRRSIREFTDSDVSDRMLEEIIEAGRWAPSGLNNQAWRLIIVQNKDTKESISKLTHYSGIIRSAPVLIVVFLDSEQMYDRTKDVQSIGACIQNMLLAAHSLGLGGVWLGEILKNKEAVNKILDAPGSYELMAVIALGHPARKERASERKALSHLVFRERFGSSW